MVRACHRRPTRHTQLTAVIVDRVLHVQSGPLVGIESRIAKIDRCRRRCQVRVGGSDEAFIDQVAIDVPFKSRRARLR